MSDNKQSSVEILEDFLLQHCNPSVCDIEWADLKTILLEAKAMHKEEIENAYWDGGQWVPTSGSQCEEYYNETFNTKEK